MNRSFGGWLVICLTTAGCGSTAYRPAHSSRIAMVSDGYVRDGKTYSRSFASGLKEATEGNQRAEEEASTAHGLMVGGFVLTIGGAGLAGAGLAMWVNGSERDAAGNTNATSSGKLGIGLAVGGLVAELIGIGLSQSGRAHELDAINIYNDGVRNPQAAE